MYPQRGSEDMNLAPESDHPGRTASKVMKPGHRVSTLPGHLRVTRFQVWPHHRGEASPTQQTMIPPDPTGPTWKYYVSERISQYLDFFK